MTTADMLRAEGWAKARAEARAEGAAMLLVRLLTRKFGELPDSARERIDVASFEQLETWWDRLLDAPNLDDVFD